jgi:MFS family permease
VTLLQEQTIIERNQAKTLRLLLIGMICLHASMAISRIASSLWVLDSGYGEWSVGLLLSLFSAGPMLLAWWAGGLSDRYTRRHHAGDLPKSDNDCLGMPSHR